MPSREEMIQFLQAQERPESAQPSQPSREEMISYLQNQKELPAPADRGLLGKYADFQEAGGKILASSKAPPLVAANLLLNTEAGKRAMGYAGGIARTAAATLTGQAGVDDWEKAAKGEAPTVGQYLERAGVPEGPKFNVPGAKALVGHPVELTARDIVGKAADVGLDPLTYAAAKVAILPEAKIPDAVKTIAKELAIPEKETAAAVREAASRLGIKPTPGMTMDSEFVQNLENSLHQSPTVGGMLTRKQTVPVLKGIQKGAEDVVSEASSASALQAGDTAKKQIAASVESKFKASTDTMNDLRQYTKDIPSTERSTRAVSRNIEAIPEVEALDLPFAKYINKQLAKNPSADQIKMLRSMAGKEAKAASGLEQTALWKIYEKLGNLEENTIKRGVISSARTASEANDIASGMLSQMRGAKKAYAAEIGKLEDVGANARLGKFNGPGGFVDKVDSIRSENLGDKLLNMSDNRLVESIKSNFPDAYDTLRRSKLGEVAKDAADAEGKLSPSRLISQTKRMMPEGRTNLFQQKNSTLSDVAMVDGSLPDMVGPSGTPKGLDYLNFLNPAATVRDLGRYAAYKGITSETVQKVAKAIAEMPEGQALMQSNPSKFNAVVVDFAKKVHLQESAATKAADQDKTPRPLKGKEKWAQEGLKKVQEHDQSLKGANLDNPKIKELLAIASDLKPGSKAMNSVVAKIKTQIAKGS